MSIFGEKKYDFIAIGDTVTDAFIRLKEARVNCEDAKEYCELCLKFADKIPYEDAYVVPAVGNSANAAVAAARLGLKSALVSNVGEDYFGSEAIYALKKERVATDFVKINTDKKTNYHYVLWYDSDRTILIKHEEYNYELPEIKSPRWAYLSSLGEHSLPFHEIIADYLDTHPEIKLAFQPGTYQIKFGKEKLVRMYKRSDIFFCNREEAQRILGRPDENDVKKLLQGIAELGPKIVVITDGTKGAYAYDGSHVWSMRAYPDPKPPLERTGAGDAFSSTFTVALAMGMSVREALRWAPINSMSVVQQVGARAGLLSRPELEKYLQEAPEDYQPKVL